MGISVAAAGGFGRLSPEWRVDNSKFRSRSLRDDNKKATASKDNGKSNDKDDDNSKYRSRSLRDDNKKGNG